MEERKTTSGISKDMDHITAAVASFEKKEDKLINSEVLLISCKGSLQNIRNTLGATNASY